MARIISLIFICLLAVPGWGAVVQLDGESLPYSASMGDVMSWDGDDADTVVDTIAGALVILGTGDSNVVIDFGGDTIYYNSGNSSDLRAISIGDYAHNAIIRNGGLIDLATTATGQSVIYIGRAKNTHMINMEGVATGIETVSGVLTSGSAVEGRQRYNTLFDGCRFFSYGDEYSRTAKNVCGAKIQYGRYESIDSADFEYTVRIVNSYFFSTHIGINVAGDGDTGMIMQMDACVLTPDARNTGGSIGNANGISATGLCASDAKSLYSYMTNTICTSGTANYGGRGIFWEHCNGTEDNPLLIRGCSVNVHQGQGVEDDISVALKLRTEAGNDGNYILIDSNYFIAESDEDGGTLAWGTRTQAIWIICGENATRWDNIIFRHNYVEARIKYEGGGVNYSYALGLQANIPPEIATPVIMPRFIENHWIGCQRIITAGKNNRSGNELNMSGDTLEFADTMDASFNRTFDLGLGSTYPSENDTVLDIVYLNGASDALGGVGVTFASGIEADIRFQRTCTVTVKGNNTQILEGASVYAWYPLYSDTTVTGEAIFSGTSDECGLVVGVASYQWFEDDGVGDITDYSPLFVKAKYAADSIAGDMTVDATNSTITLTLTGTAGDASGCGVMASDVRIDGAEIRGGIIR